MNIALAVTQAANAKSDAVRGYACARWYVRFYGLDRATRAALVKACKAHELTWLGRDSGRNKDAIYVGYDNADGKAQARAETMAATLKSHGLQCYADGEAD